MKTRILFVDDDALVLQGLQRMLRTMRDEWEMEFVPSGALALQRLQEQPFDVVVSDMRMPGMNGAQLLNEVMQRHPKTVRLILSGHADRELIMRCVGATHQYLAKPCQPEDLKLTIGRASRLESSLESQALRQLLARMDRLPSLPALYAEILAKCQYPETGLDDVADIVKRDLGMTAKVLKLVNSAFFGLGRPIADVREAVAYLGLETVKALVLSIQAFSQFEAQPGGLFSLPELWHHSLRTAQGARAIMRWERADPKLIEEAFVAGLLHDTGKLVLAVNFPRQYDAVLVSARQRRVPVVESERETFAASHAEVGGYLLGLWGLPVPVVEAIALHHTPRQSATRSLSPLTAVHVANLLQREPDREGASAERDPLDAVYLAEVGLGEHLEAWRQTVAVSFQGGEVRGS